MKALRTISIIIVGTLFVFSGTVKGIDPLGSAYKFHDYFHAFGFGTLQFLSLPLSVTLCLAEFMTGFTILTGVWRKTGIYGAFVLMLLFTPLTLVLALTNPVSDCGCFGDAVHLTNWQTFGKNLVLLALVIIIYRERSQIAGKAGRKIQFITAVITAICFLGFEIFNLTCLPVVDFLPYSTGTVIAEKMKIPDGAPVTRYETTFIYEKDGKRKEFTLKNYPASDTAWKFIEQRSKLIDKGFLPPIHDFLITTCNNRSITDSILSVNEPILIMVSKKLGEADRKKLEKGFDLGKKCLSEGIGFLVLTSSGTEEAASYNNGLLFCLADETTLKTMVRSNPGYLLLRKGKIAGKWSWANVPDAGTLLK